MTDEVLHIYIHIYISDLFLITSQGWPCMSKWTNIDSNDSRDTNQAHGHDDFVMGTFSVEHFQTTAAHCYTIPNPRSVDT